MAYYRAFGRIRSSHCCYNTYCYHSTPSLFYILSQVVARYDIATTRELGAYCVLVPMKRTITTATHDRPMPTLESVTASASTKKSTSSSSKADVVVLAAPVDVALVWKYTTVAAAAANRGSCIRDEPYFHVSLQPITTESINTTTATALSADSEMAPTEVVKPAAATKHNNDGTVIDAGDLNDETDKDIIPESVVIYERQIRKAQHSKKTSLPLSENALNVIYVDDYIVVINKPAGVLTVPGLNSNPSILDLVYHKYGVDTVTDPVHMIVHRLDMDTSGIVVFARTLAIAKQLHTFFRDRIHISKRYECLVMGHLFIPPDMNHNTATNQIDNSKKDVPVVASPTVTTKIVIDLPIQRDHVHPPFMRISTPQSEKAAMECVDQLQLHGWKKIIRKAAKPSQTIVLQILEHGVYRNDENNISSNVENPRDGSNSPQQQSSLPYTRLRLEPITGRTHQLRVHWYVVKLHFLIFTQLFPIYDLF